MLTMLGMLVMCFLAVYYVPDIGLKARLQDKLAGPVTQKSLITMGLKLPRRVEYALLECKTKGAKFRNVAWGYTDLLALRQELRIIRSLDAVEKAYERYGVIIALLMLSLWKRKLFRLVIYDNQTNFRLTVTGFRKVSGEEVLLMLDPCGTCDRVESAMNKLA